MATIGLAVSAAEAANAAPVRLAALPRAAGFVDALIRAIEQVPEARSD
jgi:hypothetical protein